MVGDTVVGSRQSSDDDGGRMSFFVYPSPFANLRTNHLVRNFYCDRTAHRPQALDGPQNVN